MPREMPATAHAIKRRAMGYGYIGALQDSTDLRASVEGEAPAEPQTHGTLQAAMRALFDPQAEVAAFFAAGAV